METGTPVPRSQDPATGPQLELHCLTICLLPSLILLYTEVSNRGAEKIFVFIKNYFIQSSVQEDKLS
jgi:hypothetical protein